MKQFNSDIMKRLRDKGPFRLNPAFYVDFYKVGHIVQYRDGIVQVISNFTPRTTRVPGMKDIVWFGFNYLAKRYLIQEFNDNFFSRPLEDVIDEYRRVISKTLNVENPRTDHIAALHKCGYLPVTFWCLPEGAIVPLQVPPLVVTNTLDDFFWLPNYLETLLSSVLWKMCTTATTAREYRKIALKHARRSGETDFGFIDWQCHDFSFRGLSGTEDAYSSGMGHLLSFSGTDTLPAILAAEHYYGADLSCGGSVPATEHSVMSAGSQEGELETFRRLLTEIYPTGILSVVSDTWDLWKVLTEYVPQLKDIILARDGKLVIRPDSGDPVNIICGTPCTQDCDFGCGDSPSHAGTLALLYDALGHSGPRGTALPLINKAAAIYGDSITLDRFDKMLTRIINELGLSPYNLVVGVGSYTYQYVTRDNYGWAMKATAVRDKTGNIIPIFKKPVTDDGSKFSHKGVVSAHMDEISGQYFFKESNGDELLLNCAYLKTFSDSELFVDPLFDDIKVRVRSGL